MRFSVGYYIVVTLCSGPENVMELVVLPDP